MWNAMDTLNEREREVLQLLANGLTVRQAAQRLGVTFHTVKNHRENVFVKLGVTTIRKAVAKLHQNRLEELGLEIPVEESLAARVLTKRELQLLILLVRYRTIARASTEMGVTRSTGSTHCENIRAKLKVGKLAQAVGALYQRA